MPPVIVVPAMEGAAAEVIEDHRETYRAEHNRVIHDLFQREGLTVTVYTRGEADNPPEKITHACVQMVLIN